MELRNNEEPLPGRAVALIPLLCVSGTRAETARYSVPEEAERGSFVANITKDLGLSGEELSARQAGLVPEGEKQYLQLDQHTGDLVVQEQMDQEELCGQSEPWLVRFEESPLQSFRAEVSLTDRNDHAPVFLNKEIVLKIPESAMPEARFLLESAQDPHVVNNSLQHYSFSSNDHFHVSTRRRSDGRRYGQLVLDQTLDREQQAEVAFSVTAVDGGSPPRSATALIRAIALVDGFSDAFLQLSHGPVAKQQPQAAQEALLTSYLTACLGGVSSLFLLSVLSFAAAKLCNARLRARLSPPSARCYADGDLAADGDYVAAKDTLSPAYGYEVGLTTDSGRSEFQFLRPVQPSPQSSDEAGAGKKEEPLCSSQPAGEREAEPGSPALRPV